MLDSMVEVFQKDNLTVFCFFLPPTDIYETLKTVFGG